MGNCSSLKQGWRTTNGKIATSRRQRQPVASRKYPTAEQFFQKAQSIREQALGVEHPDVLTTINNLVDVYVEQSKLSVAEELTKDVLAVRIRIVGPEHPAVAQTLHSMAHLSYFHGYYAHTEQVYHHGIWLTLGDRWAYLTKREWQ